MENWQCNTGREYLNHKNKSKNRNKFYDTRIKNNAAIKCYLNTCNKLGISVELKLNWSKSIAQKHDLI